MGLDMSAGSTSQATGDSGDCAQRLHSWMILKLSPFGPNSKNWNSWSETTLRELVQTNRLVPILKEISGEPNVPCTEVLGTEHESPYGIVKTLKIASYCVASNQCATGFNPFYPLP